jgi:hypothetical protein
LKSRDPAQPPLTNVGSELVALALSHALEHSPCLPLPARQFFFRARSLPSPPFAPPAPWYKHPRSPHIQPLINQPTRPPFLFFFSRVSLNKHHRTTSTKMGKDKTHVNVVVIGHVDSGKSTTTGHLSEWSRRRLASRGHCLIVVLFSSASLQVWWY